MSGSVNKVILLGTLGRDPEVRHTNAGAKIVNLSVATNERWKDKSTSESKESTEWHRVVIWNERLGDVAERFLSKGSQVYLEGQLQTRKWTDQSGQEKYTTEVVLQRFRGELTLIGGKGNGARQDDDGQEPASRGERYPAGGGKPQRGPVDLDDEIPFNSNDLALHPYAIARLHGARVSLI